MPSGFQSDLNFIVIAKENFVIKLVKAFDVGGNGKRFVKYSAFKRTNKTFVFILCNITKRNLVLHKPSGGI